MQEDTKLNLSWYQNVLKILIGLWNLVGDIAEIKKDIAYVRERMNSPEKIQAELSVIKQKSDMFIEFAEKEKRKAIEENDKEKEGKIKIAEARLRDYKEAFTLAVNKAQNLLEAKKKLSAEVEDLERQLVLSESLLERFMPEQGQILGRLKSPLEN